jgi:pimeloyl-ACP methyl ester carboxylesterase
MNRATRWAAAGAATALGVGLVAERRISSSRKKAAADADAMGALRGNVRPVTATDGISLYAEVDETAPYASAKSRRRKGEPTIVFIHGYALNLDCWHFQRRHFRGKRRLAFYDQRSHGRSDRSSMGHATIDQLGHDLKSVIEQLAPDGPVVLVGHSMGGMSIISLAEHHPELFEKKVVGVALVSTTAGGLETHKVLGPILPGPVAGMAKERLLALLSRAPKLVDTARRRGSNIAFILTDAFAFGGQVPPSYVEFTDSMLSATPFEVVAEFFPEFDALDKFHAVEALSSVPVLVACGTKDKLTPIGHSRKLVSLVEGSRLVEFVGSGHMAMLENKDELNAELSVLFGETLPGGTA